MKKNLNEERKMRFSPKLKIKNICILSLSFDIFQYFLLDFLTFPIISYIQYFS